MLRKVHLTPGRLPGMLLIAGLLIVGLFIYKDYGVAWDEADMRQIGEVNLRYIRTGNVPALENFEDKDHGGAFEVPLRWMEEPLGLTDFGDIMRFRHLCGYVFFLVGLLAGYSLALKLFRKQWIALLGLSMLVLQPRIFAHAFFNSKDVPFLVCTLLLLYTLFMAFERRRTYLFVLAGLICGYATGIRTPGLMLIGLVMLLLIASWFTRKETRRHVSLHIGSFLLSAVAMLYLSWPYLWHNPVRNLVYSVQRMSHYTAWPGDLVFNGKSYLGTKLPWYYLPEWFCISTPLLWLLPGFTGGALGLLHILQRKGTSIKTSRQKILLLCGAIVVLPVSIIIIMHSVVYDDWRHVYFIYPAFVLIALYGVEQLSKNKAARTLIITASVLQIIGTGAFIVQAHPYQQVYFNMLVPHSPEYRRRHFDYEYWGTSYKYGLEYLLQHDRRDSIPVARTFSPVAKNWQAFPPDVRRRIRWVPETSPGAYLLTNFRQHPEDYPYPKVWHIKVDGSTVLQIYRVDTSR
jgi:hypothetical protein